jgi:[ribosomal protein S5]-alanine N-acetyltransferase
MVTTLETPRLILRPLELADAEETERLFPQWEIVRFLNAVVPWPYPAGGALAHLRDSALPAMERGDEWHWTLRLKTAPEQIIGRIHLARGGNNNRGFWLVPEHQGRGLMTEAVVAVNDYWFDVLGFPVLRAPKAIANTASRRISEKTGMRMVEAFEQDYVSGRLPSELWEITAEEWHAVRKRLVPTSSETWR